MTCGPVCSSRGHWQGEICNRRKDGEIYTQWMSISVVRDPTGRDSHYVGVFTDITTSGNRSPLEPAGPLRSADGTAQPAVHPLATRACARDRGAISARGWRFSSSIWTTSRRSTTVSAMPLVTSFLPAWRATADAAAARGYARSPRRRRVRAVARASRRTTAGGRRRPGTARHPGYPLQPAGGHEVYAQASVGIGLYPDDGERADALIRGADAAMYQAKRQGRNTYRFYTEG